MKTYPRDLQDDSPGALSRAGDVHIHVTVGLLLLLQPATVALHTHIHTLQSIPENIDTNR